MLAEHRRGRDARATIGGALLATVVVIAVCAPLVAPLDPTLQRDVVATRFLSPGSTDTFGWTAFAI